MTLSDQIAIGQQKIELLLEGLQEMNEERLTQEKTTTLISIIQTFDLLIQILVERKENLLFETNAIYEEAFASVYQRKKDVQTMIANIQNLEEECNAASNKPLFQAEADISCLKKNYDDILQAAEYQLTEINSPICSFEFEQDTFLSGLIGLSSEVESNGDENIHKRPICKSHSQSMHNGKDSPSPDIETDRPSTAANCIGSDTPILGSPEKKKHLLPLPIREYAREPTGQNRSTPTLDRMPSAKEYILEKNSKKDRIKYVALERSRIVNGEGPFLRKAIPADAVVIQTNYPDSPLLNSFGSPQLHKKGLPVKTSKMLKKVNGEMEASAVGMGVRRVNSLDPTGIIETSRSQKYLQNENYARREPLRRLDNIPSPTEPSNSSGLVKKKNNTLPQPFKSKKTDSKGVREALRSLSIHSKQKFRLGETTI